MIAECRLNRSRSRDSKNVIFFADSLSEIVIADIMH